MKFPGPSQGQRVLLLRLLYSAFLPHSVGRTDPQPASHGPLDGRVFSGDAGIKGEPVDRTDTLHFNNGKFWSGNCLPCGFHPGRYWVRRVGDTIHFKGILYSPDRGAFTYTGLVRGDQIQTSINWQKDRWYWSIDRDFWFKSTLKTADGAKPAASAMQIARSASPTPERDCDL